MDVRISLIFQPSSPAPSQLLADVKVVAEGVEDDDLADLLATYVKANDAPGVIAAVLSRVGQMRPPQK